MTFFIILFRKANTSFPVSLGQISTSDGSHSSSGRETHPSAARIGDKKKKRITDKGNMGALERIHLRRVTQWMSRFCFIYRETN